MAFDGLDTLNWTTLAVVSLVLFVASLFIMYQIIIRIPADYFCDTRRAKTNLFIRIASNILGALLVLAGAIMLVTPGQGLLTLLIGISLLDFPGKRRLERRLLRQGKVLSTINAWRHRAGRAPLELEG